MIKMLHSTWAMVVLLMLVIAVINAIVSLTSNKPFKEKDLRIPLFTLVVVYIQLMLGLTAVFTSAQFHHLKEVGMGAAMKDSDIRMVVIEHPLMMIIALIVMTVGFLKFKNKSTDKEMYKTIAVYYGIALLLVLSRIPWGNWFN